MPQVQGYAVVFPGQGSQKPGMGKEIHDASEAARQVFQEISNAVGLDVANLCFNSDEETLRQTENAQIALYTVSVATCKALQEQACCVDPPRAMAGHSVGEYAALACAGVFSITDGARLVLKRGDLMARAGALRKGAMAAVLGLEDAIIEATCAAVTKPGNEVVVANYNSPGQAVISGDADAVFLACEKLKEAGAKRCIPLNVSGAFHSPLMHDAAAAMGEALKQIAFETARIPVISNVTAQPGDNWPELLEKQLRSPVRWAQSVQKMREMGVSLFFESGPGEVLSGLLKRIDSEAGAVPINSVETLRNASAALQPLNA